MIIELNRPSREFRYTERDNCWIIRITETPYVNGEQAEIDIWLHEARYTIAEHLYGFVVYTKEHTIIDNDFIKEVLNGLLKQIDLHIKYYETHWMRD